NVIPFTMSRIYFVVLIFGLNIFGPAFGAGNKTCSSTPKPKAEIIESRELLLTSLKPTVEDKFFSVDCLNPRPVMKIKISRIRTRTLEQYLNRDDAESSKIRENMGILLSKSGPITCEHLTVCIKMPKGPSAEGST